MQKPFIQTHILSAKTYMTPNVYILEKQKKIETYLSYLKTYKHANLKELKLFKKAYIMMLERFKDKYRQQKRIPYFEHMEEVMNIVLYLPDSTPQQVITALLHDAIEDVQHISLQTLKQEFTPEIANNVQSLTKFSLSDNKWINATRYLERFARIHPDILVIKFADRLHNLQTLKGIHIRKVIRKIVETEYFFYFKIKDNSTLKSLQNQIKESIHILKSHPQYRIMYHIHRTYYQKKYAQAQKVLKK